MTEKATRGDSLFERRVRWAEIDAQKIVFNGHYLMYLDTAVAGYWRALALPYAPTMESLEGDLYVRKATLEYHASALYDDLIDVGMRCERIGNTSMLLAAAVFRRDAARLGELRPRLRRPAHADRSPGASVPARHPDRFRGRRGDARRGDRNLAAARPRARALRAEVFVEEQGIPAAMATDDADMTAVHALARNRPAAPSGPAACSPRRRASANRPHGGDARCARRRRSRVARRACRRGARSRGDREVVLDAQITAVEFYRRAGFEAPRPASSSRPASCTSR